MSDNFNESEYSGNTLILSCPRCTEGIASYATGCSVCGAEFTGQEITSRREAVVRGTIIVVVFVILFFGSAYLVMPPS